MVKTQEINTYMEHRHLPQVPWPESLVQYGQRLSTASRLECGQHLSTVSEYMVKIQEINTYMEHRHLPQVPQKKYFKVSTFGKGFQVLLYFFMFLVCLQNVGNT